MIIIYDLIIAPATFLYKVVKIKLIHKHRQPLSKKNIFVNIKIITSAVRFFYLNKMRL